jgi:hypothetical protein
MIKLKNWNQICSNTSQNGKFCYTTPTNIIFSVPEDESLPIRFWIHFISLKKHLRKISHILVVHIPYKRNLKIQDPVCTARFSFLTIFIMDFMYKNVHIIRNPPTRVSHSEYKESFYHHWMLSDINFRCAVWQYLHSAWNEGVPQYLENDSRPSTGHVIFRFISPNKTNENSRSVFIRSK